MKKAIMGVIVAAVIIGTVGTVWAYETYEEALAEVEAKLNKVDDTGVLDDIAEAVTFAGANKVQLSKALFWRGYYYWRKDNYIQTITECDKVTALDVSGSGRGHPHYISEAYHLKGRSYTALAKDAGQRANFPEGEEGDTAYVTWRENTRRLAHLVYAKTLTVKDGYPRTQEKAFRELTEDLPTDWRPVLDVLSTPETWREYLFLARMKNKAGKSRLNVAVAFKNALDAAAMITAATEEDTITERRRAIRAIISSRAQMWWATDQSYRGWLKTLSDTDRALLR